jgi:hypothetical protein
MLISLKKHNIWNWEADQTTAEGPRNYHFREDVEGQLFENYWWQIYQQLSKADML